MSRSKSFAKKDSQGEIDAIFLSPKVQQDCQHVLLFLSKTSRFDFQVGHSKVHTKDQLLSRTTNTNHEFLQRQTNSSKIQSSKNGGNMKFAIFEGFLNSFGTGMGNF